MQVIKLSLHGRYYDSQIYSGNLYLWTIDGRIITLSWERLINNLIDSVPENLKFAAHCAFKDNQFLYGQEWQLLFRDSAFQGLLLTRFDELNKFLKDFSFNDFSAFVINEQDNPFQFPHSDTLIYYDRLFVAGKEGIAVRRRYGTQYAINDNIEKLWDSPVLSMAGSHLALALATGQDGVYEYSLDSQIEKNEPRNLLDKFSNYVRWLYPSFFSSSYGTGYFADFRLRQLSVSYNEKRQNIRELESILSSNELFTNTSDTRSLYTWGSYDKICSLTKEHIKVLKYTPRRKMGGERKDIGKLELPNQLGSEIISADNALFGFVIELDDGLFIIDSQLNFHWFGGEPVNWRVFPNTKNYTNQLHVIYSDQVNIFSFNDDYFVNQTDKFAGIDYRHQQYQNRL